jgi:hypothetical protein
MLNRKNTISCKTIAAKKANSAADASALEGEIDRLVYQLYGLTKEEMALVKGGSKTRSQMALAISFNTIFLRKQRRFLFDNANRQGF